MRESSLPITVGSEVHRPWRLCLASGLLVLLGAPFILHAQAPPTLPRIKFTKALKGSIPEFKALSVDTSGHATYESHALGDTSSPRELQISEATTARIFALAQALSNFRSLDLDSHHRVANMGLKTISYQNGEEVNKVQFNFTENRTAQHLTDIFENISNVEERINQLEYDMKYDHLDLPQALLQIQQGMSDGLFVETALMIPTLEKISTNSRFMHLAQFRAQEIMQRIQQTKQ